MNKMIMIYKKEMKSLFRDKKALLTLFLPILLYPVLMIFLFGIMSLVQSNTALEVNSLYVHSTVPSDWLEVLKENESLSLKIGEEIPTDLNFDEIHAYLLPEGEIFTLIYHSNIDSSERAFYQVNKTYETFIASKKSDFLASFNLKDAYDQVVTFDFEEISGDGESRFIVMLVGMLLPFLIVLYGIIGTNLLSSDLSAGEKERATLETIFSVPVKRFEIIMGKLLACTTVGIISGGVNILAIFPVVFAITANIPDLSFHFSIGLMMFLFLQLIPIMIMASALFIAIGMFAKTYQESQSYSSVALIGLMALSYIFLIPNLEASTLLYALPITNAMLLMREAILGSYPLTAIFQVLFINLGVSALSVMAMHFVFQSDWVIFGGDN